jgi:hypothetical protein
VVTKVLSALAPSRPGWPPIPFGTVCLLFVWKYLIDSNQT